MAKTDRTTVQCSAETRNRLRHRKSGGESYEEVLRRLLSETKE